MIPGWYRLHEESKSSGTKELIYKAGTDSQDLENEFMVTGEKGKGEG